MSKRTPNPITRSEETARTDALRALDVLDTEAEAAFDGLVQAAAAVCQVPMAFVGLMDSERLWLKARSGLDDLTEIPRNSSVCNHALRQKQPLVVPDTLADPRFALLPVVTGAPHVRFYAGVQLRLGDGLVMGTLCVMDHAPGQLSEDQLRTLEQLAAAAAQLLQARKLRRDEITAQQMLDQAGRLASVGSWVLDTHGPTIYLSMHAARLHGLQPGYQDGLRKVLDCYSESSRGEVRARLEAALENGVPFDFEVALQATHGVEVTERWVRMVGEVRVEPGQAPRLFGSLQDITTEREAQRALRARDAMLQSAISALDEAFVVFDPQGRLTYFNEKYRDLYPLLADLVREGVDFETLVRAGVERGQFMGAVGREAQWLEKRLEDFARDGSQITERLPDGRVIRALDRHTPDGYSVGFRVDITEQENMRSEAHEALEAKARFLSTLSHEIRTPINAVLGMIALMRRSGLDTRQLMYAQKAEEATQALLNLLNDVLDISRLESGRLVVEHKPFSLDRMLHDLAVIFSGYTVGKDVEVMFDIDPHLPDRLVGDVLRLQQVLLNLGTNAIKFTPQGQVVIAIAQAGGDHSGLGQGRVALSFEVRDTGIGIDADQQEAVFKPFVQADASTARRFGGSGLGLAICRQLVELMGSRLSLKSQLGQGSCFSFTLELEVEDRPGTVPGVVPDAIPAAPTPLRVLVVDDSEITRRLLVALCASLGWHAQSADGGAAALAVLRSATGPVDLVLVDWQMPGMDGWETCRAIRALGLPKSPRLVMSTAHGLDLLTGRSQADLDMLDGYLLKPVTRRMLQDVAEPKLGLAALRQVSVTSAASEALEAEQTLLPRALLGLRVLVADDNASNRMVLGELLQAEGADVTLVDDGAQAVERVRQGLSGEASAIDMVLMDMQMPVLDGIQASRQIRDRLRQHVLPILAMTANTDPADRAACLAAGMNEHMGKPFRMTELVSMLVRLRTGSVQPSGPSLAHMLGNPSPVAQDSEDTVDAPDDAAAAAAVAAGVAMASALDRLAGKRVLYLRVVAGFVAELPEHAQQLLAAAQADDAVAVRRCAHSLRGAAATVGMAALSQCCAELETGVTALPAPLMQAPLVRAVLLLIDEAYAPLSRFLQALEAANV